MQNVIVRFPEARTVFSHGLPIGSTADRLWIEEGQHEFSLSDPQDYAPPCHPLVVTGTSAAHPLIVTFVQIPALFAQWFPKELGDFRALLPNVDAALAHFAPAGLRWQTRRDDEAGKASASAVLQMDPATGEMWLLAVLEQAKITQHRHNSGGDYGEMTVTLAGELTDVDDLNRPLKLGVNTVQFHASGTIHQPLAAQFWLGLIHQPRGSVLVP